MRSTKPTTSSDNSADITASWPVKTCVQAELDAADKKTFTRIARLRPGTIVSISVPGHEGKALVMAMNTRVVDANHDAGLFVHPAAGRVWCSTSRVASKRIVNAAKPGA